MKIYTKTGDGGDTGLLGGRRVPKDDPRVCAYGDVDELNALLGVVRAHGEDTETDALLARIQRDLFALGAQLADPEAAVTARVEKTALGDPTHLETAIDLRDARLPALRAFILPGGSRCGAFLHLARTVCRRAERSVIALSHADRVDERIVVYLNRLSDLLFVMARDENHRLHQPEDTW
jgi:cob(I)alamin adenosyltransferase